MKPISFRNFVLYSSLLNLGWAFISTRLESLVSRDMGLLTWAGFMIVYSLTYFIHLHKSKSGKRDIPHFVMLLFFFAATFGLSLVITGPLLYIEDKLGIFPILIASSLPAAAGIFFTVNLFFCIKRKGFTYILTFLAALLASALFFIAFDTPEKLEDIFGEILHPLAIGYCLWQLLTSIAIGYGISSNSNTKAYEQHATGSQPLAE